MTDTNELRKLLAAATPPPWYGTWSISTADGDPIASTDVSLASDLKESDANGDLIVAAVNALPALLDELDAARAAINMAEGEADHALDGEYFNDLCDAVRMLRTERDAARADLREAMELLRAHGEPPNWLRQAWLRREPGDDTTAFHTWNRRYGKLLAKHKETP